MTLTEDEQWKRTSHTASAVFDYPSSTFAASDDEEKTKKKKSLATSAATIIPRLFVDAEILYLLNFGSKSGYELKKELFRLFGVKVSYGTLYPHLHSLEKSTLIQGTWKTDEDSAGPNKKLYTLTQEGSSALRESIATLGRIGLGMEFSLNKVDLGLGTQLQSNERESTFSTVQAILRRRGYTTSRDVIVKGVSGNEYQFGIIATRVLGSKVLERTIVLVVDCRIGDLLSLDYAMRMLAAAQDLGAGVLLFAVPQLKPDVAGFLDFHKIVVFDGGNWQEVISGFLLRFDRSLE